MTDTEDPYNEVGYMAYCGYQWSHGVGYMAPGHNSVLHDKDGNWYLVNHIRQKEYIGDWLEPSTMQIRKMYWSESGWPVVAPSHMQERSSRIFHWRRFLVNMRGLL